jgi:hypothetical protein
MIKENAIDLLKDVLVRCKGEHAEILIKIREHRIEHIDYTIKNIPKLKEFDTAAL